MGTVRQSRMFPVMLVHGVAVRDASLRESRVWGRLPGRLRSEGFDVGFAAQDAWGSCADNAACIVRAAEDLLSAVDAKKLHIIAHSKGGLDALLAATDPALHGRVASLTTLASPHGGLKFCGFLEKIDGVVAHTAVPVVNAIGRHLGDEAPDGMAVLRDLTTSGSAARNASVTQAFECFVSDLTSSDVLTSDSLSSDVPASALPSPDVLTPGSSLSDASASAPSPYLLASDSPSRHSTSASPLPDASASDLLLPDILSVGFVTGQRTRAGKVRSHPKGDVAGAFIGLFDGENDGLVPAWSMTCCPVGQNVVAQAQEGLAFTHVDAADQRECDIPLVFPDESRFASLNDFLVCRLAKCEP